MSHFLVKNIPAEQSNSWIHLGETIDWVNAQESDDISIVLKKNNNTFSTLEHVEY